MINYDGGVCGERLKDDCVRTGVYSDQLYRFFHQNKHLISCKRMDEWGPK